MKANHEFRAIQILGNATKSLIRILLSEFLTPFPNRFVGYFNGTIQHHFLDIPIAQRKGIMQPNAIANNFAGESMTGIHGQAGAIKVELVRLFYIQVNLTIPN